MVVLRTPKIEEIHEYIMNSTFDDSEKSYVEQLILSAHKNELLNHRNQLLHAQNPFLKSAWEQYQVALSLAICESIK